MREETRKNVLKAKSLVETGLTVEQACKKLKMSQTTWYRFKDQVEVPQRKAEKPEKEIKPAMVFEWKEVNTKVFTLDEVKAIVRYVCQ